MTPLSDRLAQGEVILLDGATGTELEKRGVPMDGVAWSAAALKTHPETVRQVHADYIRAGADIIITNTFAAARHVLAPAGLGDQVRELNSRAVALAQEARDQAAQGRPVFIAGSISTFDAHNSSRYQPSLEQAQANYHEQAAVLAEAGVDLFMLEMMRDLEQAGAAVRAAVATGLPVWIGFSCHLDPNGVVRLLHRAPTLAEALQEIPALGGAGVTIMHSLTEDILPALHVVKQHWPGPFGAYAHSGTFTMPNWHFDQIISPADYAAAALAWVEAGAQLIGGCCGIGPEHIRLLRERLPRRIEDGREADDG
jgi:homocysteine S-methyltransferase